MRRALEPLAKSAANTDATFIGIIHVNKSTSSDVLTTLKYDWLMQYHEKSQAELTIACHRCNTKIDLGVIEFDGRLHVTGYREKPTRPYDVSMGVYVFNCSNLQLFEPGQYIDFPSVVKLLIDRGEIDPATVSMASIRDWLAQHPERVDEVLWHNRSYIFFRDAPVDDLALGPVAAAKTVLETAPKSAA